MSDALARQIGDRIPVIAVVGGMGCGKSTVSNFLVREFGASRMSFAGPLKDMLRSLGLTEKDVNGPPEHRSSPCDLLGGKSPRFAMQTLGTEWGRKIVGENLWANALQRRIVEYRTSSYLNGESPRVILIDDARFPNEVRMVRQLGGQVWRIRRPGHEKATGWLTDAYYRGGPARLLALAARLFGWKPLHESEFHWRHMPVDKEFINAGALSELKHQVTQYALGLTHLGAVNEAD